MRYNMSLRKSANSICNIEEYNVHSFLNTDLYMYMYTHLCGSCAGGSSYVNYLYK